MAGPRVSEVVSDAYVVSIGRGAFSTKCLSDSLRVYLELVDAGWFDRPGLNQWAGGTKRSLAICPIPAQWPRCQDAEDGDHCPRGLRF
jgi:hypothetical protein